MTTWNLASDEKTKQAPLKTFRTCRVQLKGADRSLEELQINHYSTHIQESCSFQYMQLPTMCKEPWAISVVGRECLPVLGGKSVWSHNWQYGAQEEDHLSLKRLTAKNCFCRQRGGSPEWRLGKQGWRELLTWKVSLLSTLCKRHLVWGPSWVTP